MEIRFPRAYLILKREEIRSYETSITNYQSTRRNMQEDLNLTKFFPSVWNVLRPICCHVHTISVWRKFHVLLEKDPAFTFRAVRLDVYETGVISKRIRCRVLGGGAFEVLADAKAEGSMGNKGRK